jgi:hypothetical protein
MAAEQTSFGPPPQVPEHVQQKACPGLEPGSLALFCFEHATKEQMILDLKRRRGNLWLE